jgi:transposase
MKVLFWDGDGLAIYFKRLEEGTFNWKWGDTNLNRKTFLLLLEGVVPKKFERRFSLKKA